jgi:antagonist of KipI
MSLRVAAPGVYSLPVDRGRPGWRSYGVPVGGAADRAAHALANALVGNPPDAVTLEITLAGPTLTADGPTACVLFGAPFHLDCLGRAPPTAGTTFTLHAGETLRILGTPVGVRGYLAVRGGLQRPEVMGSRSALEPVRAGDVLACAPSKLPGRALPFVAVRDLGGDAMLRVLPGTQADWFPPGALEAGRFTVTAASNRMGVRLAGDPLPRVPGRVSAEMASEPVAPGAVQVANDGRPILLGVDGQTIGGYPRPAHVIRADLDALAQLRPGSGVRFREVTVAEAEQAARVAAAELADWCRRLAWV